MSACFTTPAPYQGTLSEYLASDHHSARPRAERERRWHRAHMRGWAGFWRRAAETAALLGRPLQEVAGTDLAIAKSYRDHSRIMEAKS